MTGSETIAVTGATGQLGRLVIADLLARTPAPRIVAMVRTPAAKPTSEKIARKMGKVPSQTSSP